MVEQVVKDGAGRHDPPPLSRRAHNKARTTAAILEAAKACIAESGVQGATMDQIAAKADIARATLFNYFPSKSEIVVALIDQNEAGFYRAVDRWRAAEGIDTAGRMLGLFRATGRYLQRASPLERLLVGVSWLNWNDESSTGRIDRVLDAFGGLLADGRARGEIGAAIDLTVAAEIICHTYLGIIHAWRMDPEYPTAQRLDASARLLGGMLGGVPGSSNDKAF
jgi:AcrR family transcriptional regulator